MDNYSKLRAHVATYAKKYKTPNSKENLELFKQLYLLREALPGSNIEYTKLKDRLIISNGAFAMKYAIIYCKQINDSDLIEDLFQQAQIGIIEAVGRFDPHRGYNFTTFAYFYVRKCIIDFIKRNKVIAVNRNIARYIKHISEINDKILTEQEGFMPTVESIQDRLKSDKGIDIKPDVIITLLNLIELNSTSELSFTTDNFDNISYEENYNSLLMMQISILNDLIDLTDDELTIIKMRFGIGYDRPYYLDEIKLIKKLSDEEIKHIIQVSNLYIE